MRFILFLLGLSALCFGEDDDVIPSTPEQISSLRGDLLIQGLVNPISGQLSLYEQDLVVKGAQEIILGRSYVAPFIPHFKNDERHDKFQLYHHLSKEYVGWTVLPHLRLKRVGEKILVPDPSGMVLEFVIRNGKAELSEKPYGISNAVGEQVSGCFDPRNTQIFIEEDLVRVVTSDRTIRHYRNNRLQKEILPNGKVLKYTYTQGVLASIESLDPSERYTYATLNCLGYNPLAFSSSDLKVEFQKEKRRHAIEFTDRQKYSYHERKIDKPSPSLITSVKSPFFHSHYSFDERFLLTQGENRNQNFECTYTIVRPKDKETPHYRIDKLFLPEGGSTSFTYEPVIIGKKEGKTTVCQEDGTSIVYTFSSHLLPTSIQWYESTILRKEKKFVWTENQWLKSVEVLGEQQELLYRREYVYDSFGNPIVETFKGTLTGEPLPLIKERNLFFISEKTQYESTKIKRVFSDDGFNLLLREETDEGKVTTYAYLPGTNLLTKKEVEGYSLETFTYDDCHHLIENTFNEKTTKYTLRQEAPFLHLPEWVEEIGLRKTHLLYDTWGNVTQEIVYDAEGNLAFSISRTFNQKGELLSETNPLGDLTTTSYDERGHLLTKNGPSFRQKMVYDLKGRLIQLNEESHQTNYVYDGEDHLIQKTDLFGQKTHFIYDPITHLVKESSFLEAKTQSAYDAEGRLLSKTDPNGNITRFAYNAYGSPIEILHPDGGKETFRYTRVGRLKTYTDQDGNVTEYSYDPFGRLLLKKDPIGEETFTYDAFHLTAFKDKESFVTSYTYDELGRKLSEARAGRTTIYSYDPLDRLASISESNFRRACYRYDLLGRVIEENRSDLFKESTAYDDRGNRASVTKGEGQVFSFCYDAFDRLIEEKDPLGQIKTITYLETDHLEKITKDPRGITTREVFDPHGRLIQKAVSNLSLEEMCYDAAGNIIAHKDCILDRETLFSYTTRHQLASSTRPGRTTSYTYTLAGQKKTKTLPDGNTLFYAYDKTGHLTSLQASDGSVHLHLVITASDISFVQQIISKTSQ